MLENANEIILHGFAYKDFLREIPNPQVCLCPKPLCAHEATVYQKSCFALCSALNETPTAGVASLTASITN